MVPISDLRPSGCCSVSSLPGTVVVQPPTPVPARCIPSCRDHRRSGTTDPFQMPTLELCQRSAWGWFFVFPLLNEKGAWICFRCIPLSPPEFPPARSGDTVSFPSIPEELRAHPASTAFLRLVCKRSPPPAFPNATSTRRWDKHFGADLLERGTPASTGRPQPASKSLLAQIYLLLGQHRNHLPAGRTTKPNWPCSVWGAGPLPKDLPEPTG